VNFSRKSGMAPVGYHGAVDDAIQLATFN